MLPLLPETLFQASIIGFEADGIHMTTVDRTPQRRWLIGALRPPFGTFPRLIAAPQQDQASEQLGVVACACCNPHLSACSARPLQTDDGAVVLIQHEIVDGINSAFCRRGDIRREDPLACGGEGGGGRRTPQSGKYHCTLLPVAASMQRASTMPLAFLGMAPDRRRALGARGSRAGSRLCPWQPAPSAHRPWWFAQRSARWQSVHQGTARGRPA